MKFNIIDSHHGDKIDSFPTLEEAEEALSEYEAYDRREWFYTSGFYEIEEVEEGESPTPLPQK